MMKYLYKSPKEDLNLQLTNHIKLPSRSLKKHQINNKL